MKVPLKRDRVPLYRSIAAIIENKIISGQYDPGSQLPTEDELTRQFNVSKITVRNALLLLEVDQLIVRRWGKGNFVSEEVPKRKKLIFTNLVDMTKTLSRTVTKPLEIKNIPVKTCRNPKTICEFFGMSNEDEIGIIRRIVMRDGILLFYENFMPVDYVKNITEKELARKKSVQDILKEKIGLKVTKGKMYLEAIPAEPDIAQMLECQSFDPVIHNETYFWSDDEIPFEIVNIYFHASHFKQTVDVEVEN
jgi:DNA-binding GntR family transcriptional regulator